MAKLFKTFVRNTVFKKDNNLVSLDDWYSTVLRLLKGHQINGILDAGASDGRLSLKLLEGFTKAKAYAFEPNPIYCETLKNLSKKHPRFVPQFCGLSEKAGSVDFYITDNIGSSSMFQPSSRFQESHPQESAVKKKTK